MKCSKTTCGRWLLFWPAWETQHFHDCRRCYCTAVLQALAGNHSKGLMSMKRWTCFWNWEVETMLLHRSTSLWAARVVNIFFRKTAVLGSVDRGDGRHATGHAWMAGALRAAMQGCTGGHDLRRSPEPHNRISAWGAREHSSSGEGESGRGGGPKEARHLRRAEEQYRPEVWWRPLLTFTEHLRQATAKIPRLERVPWSSKNPMREQARVQWS